MAPVAITVINHVSFRPFEKFTAKVVIIMQTSAKRKQIIIKFLFFPRRPVPFLRITSAPQNI